MELEQLLNEKTNHPEVDAQLSRLQKDYKERMWSDFGIKLIDLLYTFRSFNAQRIIRSVNKELTTSIDPYVQLEIMDIFLSRDNSPMDEKLKIIDEFKQFFEKNEIGKVYLNLIAAKHLLLANDVEQSMSKLEETEKEMNKLRNYPKILYSILNFTKMTYYWRKQDMLEFTKAAHQYLAYTERFKLNREEQLDISERIVSASLISDSILNFGDILETDFFGCLTTVEDKKPLWDLVVIFNRGKVDEFIQFIDSQRHQLDRLPLISQNFDKLDRKIRVIALYDEIFFSENSFNKQHISFREIANIAKIDMLHVERLLVHVLSIDLIKGVIDEPNEVFNISELKPRGLDKERVVQLRDKFRNWQGGVSQTLNFINSSE